MSNNEITQILAKLDYIEKTHTAKLESLERTHTRIHYDLSEKVDSIAKQVSQIDEKTQPIVELHGDFKSTTKIIKYFILGFMTLGGFYLMIKDVFKQPV